MKMKKFAKTIREFLSEGHQYAELQGRRIMQEGEILYISNRLFTEKEINNTNEYVQWMMQYQPEVRFVFWLYGNTDPDDCMVTRIWSQVALVEEEFDIPEGLDDKAIFEYGGYSFIPAGTWDSWHIQGDFKELQQHLKSDWETHLNNYRKGGQWSHGDFYKAAGGPTDDIFFCVERQRYYVPCENELFLLKPLL